jgi:transcriptional regulator with XRE-family HTH domain
MTFMLSTQIKKARAKAGMTQAELAEKLCIAPNTLGGWEAGRHEPKIIYLHEIAQICQVRVAWLIGESVRPPLDSIVCKPFGFRSLESVKEVQE